jgi:hypothetical protein
MKRAWAIAAIVSACAATEAPSRQFGPSDVNASGSGAPRGSIVADASTASDAAIAPVPDASIVSGRDAFAEPTDASIDAALPSADPKGFWCFHTVFLTLVQDECMRTRASCEDARDAARNVQGMKEIGECRTMPSAFCFGYSVGVGAVARCYKSMAECAASRDGNSNPITTCNPHRALPR